MALDSAPSSQQSNLATEFGILSSTAASSPASYPVVDSSSSHSSISRDSISRDSIVGQYTSHDSRDDSGASLPFVSVVIPAYNEAAILLPNLQLLYAYLEDLETEYRWEMILVNDGSRDQTGDIAEAFASSHKNVYVIHHFSNLGLGQALKTGFQHCRGDYVVTLDLDLSYAPEHIERLLTRMRQTHAKVVVTSPYMKGGKVTNVPELRKFLSVWANRFLSLAAKRNVATLTGMVRAYDARFLESLNLRSSGMEVNPEVIHKAMLLEEKIEEIPAHLNWHLQQPIQQPYGKTDAGRTDADRTATGKAATGKAATGKAATGKAAKEGTVRRSSMKILRHTWAIFYYGFVFRPVMFFVIPSLIFFLLSLYCIVWMFIHAWNQYQLLAQTVAFPDPTEAVAIAFQQAPHTFIIGGMLLMLSIQLFSLGILAVQSKRYFEEIFYLGTAIYRSTRQPNQPK